MESVFEGYLFKSPPQITKKWRKRYFVLLASKKLLYYTDPNGTYKGTIDLTYCQEVEYDVYFEKAEYRNALSIKLSNTEASSNNTRDTNRVFYLLANSRQLMNTWYQHLIDVAELKIDSKQEHNVITNNLLPQDCYVSARRQVNSDKTNDKVSYNPSNDSIISSNEFVDLGAYSLGGRTLSEVSQLEIAADDDNSSSDDETEVPSLPPLPKPNYNNNRKSCIQDYSSVKYSFTSETSSDSGYSPTTMRSPRQAEIVESPDNVPPFNNPPLLPSGNQPPSNHSTNQLSYARSVPLTSNFPPVPLPRANQLPSIPSSNKPPPMPTTNYPLPMPPSCNSLPIRPTNNPPPMPPMNNPPPMPPMNNPPPMPPTNNPPPMPPTDYPPPMPPSCNSLPIPPTNNPPPMPPTNNPPPLPPTNNPPPMPPASNLPPMPPTSIPPPMRPNGSNTPPRRSNSGNPLPKSPTTNPPPMPPTTNPPPMPPSTYPLPMSPSTYPPPMPPSTYPPSMPPTTNPPPMSPTTNPPPMPPTTNPPPMPPTTNPPPMPPTSSNHPPLPYPPNSNNRNYNNYLSETKPSCPPVPKHRDLNIDLPLDTNNNNNNNNNNNPRPPKRFDSQKKHKVAKSLSQDNNSNNNLKNYDNNNDNNDNNNNNNNNNNKFLNSKFKAKSLRNINHVKSGINPHSKSIKVSNSVTEESSGFKNNYDTITHHRTALPTNDLPPHLDMPSPVSISPYSVVVRKSDSLIEEEHIYSNEQDGSAEQMYMNGNPDTGMYIRFDPAPSTLDLQSDGGYVSIRSKGARILEDDGGITVDVGGYVKVTSASNNNNNNNNNNDIQENPYTSVKSNLIK